MSRQPRLSLVTHRDHVARTGDVPGSRLRARHHDPQPRAPKVQADAEARRGVRIERHPLQRRDASRGQPLNEELPLPDGSDELTDEEVAAAARRGADWLPNGYERLFEPQHTQPHASTIARWLTGYDRLRTRRRTPQPRSHEAAPGRRGNAPALPASGSGFRSPRPGAASGHARIEPSRLAVLTPALLRAPARSDEPRRL